MIVKKIIDNIGPKAFATLGLRQYLVMISKFVSCLPKVLSSKSLVPLDQEMSAFEINIKFFGTKYFINLKYIDNNIIEGSYAFGGVREIFIRNCYFRFHKINFNTLKNVVDLGGNRGLFSTLCAPFAKNIVIVEPETKYNNTIKYNVLNNNPSVNLTIINNFIGSKSIEHLTINEIINKSNFNYIDFLKIDIEGAEFNLFEDNIPFEKIRYISMEVHPEHGNVLGIIEKLSLNNFKVITCTSNFAPTSNPQSVDYIYAENLSF